MANKSFREIVLNESVTEGQVSKVIKDLQPKLTIVDYRYFEVDTFSTDAGLGGNKIVRVFVPYDPRGKRRKDTDLVIDTLKNKFNVTIINDDDKGTMYKIS